MLDVLTRELKKRGINTAKETAQEVAQEGVTIAGSQAASMLERGDWQYSAQEVGKRLGDTAVSSALTFGVLNVPGGVRNVSAGLRSNTAVAKQPVTTSQVSTEPDQQSLDLQEEELSPEAAADFRKGLLGDEGDETTQSQPVRAIDNGQAAVYSKSAEAQKDAVSNRTSVLERTAVEQQFHTAMDERTKAALVSDAAADYTKTEREGLAYDGEEVHLRDRGQRPGGADPGGQVSGLEEGAGRAEGWNAEGRSADRGAAALTYAEEKVSARWLGITGGTESRNVHIVTGGDTEHTRAAKQLAQERGLKLVLFGGGNLEIRQNGGTTASARAYIIGDRVYVRADHPRYTSEQLMRHEAGHDRIAKGEINPNTVRARIGAEWVHQISRMYAEAYEGSGMTAEEIWEEIICDSLADMNIFSEQESAETAAEFLEETKKASAVAEAEQSRGPPEGKMSREWQSYELSDEFLMFIKANDRHAFLRSLANKTADMKDGDVKRLVFRINSSVYFFKADGYMSGHLEHRIPIRGNNAIIEKIQEVFLHGIDESTDTSDSLAEGYGLHRRGNDWDSSDGGYTEETRRADELYGGETDSDTAGYFEEIGGDFEEVVPGSIVYDGMGNAYIVDEGGVYHKFSQEPARTLAVPEIASVIQERVRASVRDELVRMDKKYDRNRIEEKNSRDTQLPEQSSDNEFDFFYNPNTQLEVPTEIDAEAFLYGLDSAYELFNPKHKTPMRSETENAQNIDDFDIGRSLGAKAKNYDIIDKETGILYHFVEESRIQNAEVFAGSGVRKKLLPEVAEGLVREFGGKLNDWQHAKGFGDLTDGAETRVAEVHWFQAKDIGKVKFKVKRWLDE